MLIVLVVLGTLVSIGGGIGASTISLFRLRAAAEKLMQDIRASREAAVARGPLIRAGTGGQGIHFLRGKIEIRGNAQFADITRGFSYVPFGFTLRRDFVQRPATPTAATGETWSAAVVNVPDGINLTIGPPGAGPAPVAGDPAGQALIFSTAGSIGFLDGASQAAASTIDLTDPAVGTYRITITGPPGGKCNPVMEFLQQP